jgi:glycine/D-amino acid oxidase-like deaminating enzyme/Rieske Fe-S protein
MGEPESYWLQTAEPLDYPALSEDRQVDVAVVGGGMAGLCAAWEIARTGRRVAVLEADRIASATTGHTTAKLTALHTLVYGEIRASRGAETAAQYARAQSEALEHVAGIIEELGLDCDFERRPAYTYTRDDRQVARYRDEAVAASEAGLAADFMTPEGLPFSTAGAVRVQEQAQFHPYRFLQGLAADIIARDGLIYEHTRVMTGDSGTPCRLKTDGGATVTADAVLVTTGWPIFDRPELLARLKPRRELVVAGPIPAESDPGGMFVTPEEGTRSVRSAPLDEGRRLLIVTGETHTGGSGGIEKRYQDLARWAAQFGMDEVAYRWSAQDYSTSDHVPFVGRYPGRDGFWLATGFGGWGMTNSVAAARLLTASVADGADGTGAAADTGSGTSTGTGTGTGGTLPDWAAAFDPHRFHPMSEVRSIAGVLGTTARNFVGRPGGAIAVDTPADVRPGEAAVLRISGEEVAVYRDDQGELHAVGARCSHRGCRVGFNDAERTWECPCHGSRFDVSGAVLQGPALQPLPHKTVPGPSGTPDGGEQ